MKMQFDQDLRLNFRYDFGKMNSTLGSVVPLAMFEINTDGFFDLHAQVDLRCMLKLKQRSPLLVSRHLAKGINFRLTVSFLLRTSGFSLLS